MILAFDLLTALTPEYRPEEAAHLASGTEY